MTFLVLIQTKNYIRSTVEFYNDNQNKRTKPIKPLTSQEDDGLNLLTI